MVYDIAPSLQEFREKLESKHPESKLDEMDWLRCSHALKYVKGDSALEIGPGVGMIIDSLTKRGIDVAGLDLAPQSKAMFPEGIELQLGSIADPLLKLEKYSTVICMEVLEHLQVAANPVALANLRYAATERLIITVPYNEREPLWHADQPGGHRQKFTIDKAAEVFPNAYATMLPRYYEEWLFIIEDKANPAPYFSLVSRSKLAQITGASQ